MNKSFFKKKKTLNCRGNIIELDTPKVMGVLNITPDSFYSSSRLSHPAKIIDRVKQDIQYGADIIDIGAYSSRPGAQHISEVEEWQRIEPVLKVVREAFPEILISVDTFRSDIAGKAIKYFGVDIINDISAGTMDSEMLKTVGLYSVPYVMMHMQGTPQNMQQNPDYSFLLKEIFSFLAERIKIAYQAGIKDIILDPGFGFGKTISHNYELLNRLEEFKIFELPLLVGFSRKSMIQKVLNVNAEESLNGTTVLNTIALTKSADILRVHDVKEAVQAVLLFNTTAGSN